MYKLIIVDDEIGICEGIAECYPWNELGFEIVGTFHDGKKAFDYIERYCVDVVLSDIRMPIMDGLELAKQLKQRYPQISLVLLSGHAEFEYAQTALRYGVKDYILKPIQYDIMIQVFTRIYDTLNQLSGIKLPDMNTPGYYDQIVNEVIQYLESNYQNASLEEAALQVALSPNYLSKILKRKTGKNFSEYVLDFKMEKAALFLRDISLKTYEIAALVGYDNPKNFSRAFKQYFGKTPREFRE